MRKFNQYLCILAAMVVAACSQNQHTANVVRPGELPGAVSAESPEPAKEVVKQGPSRGTRKSSVRRERVEPSSQQPSTPVRKFEPRMPGKRVSQVNVPGMYVALTFDDGPSAAYTPQILDILRRHGARATFFVLGENAVRNPGILARAVAEGHEIANHTYSHIKMTTSGKQTIAREIERTSEAIKSATGYYPTAMRPPYGATNAELVEIMSRDYGMHSVLWDVDTRDWQHPGVGKVVERAVGKARPGSIILLHDIHASTLAAVEQVVTGLQARGFKLVTVSQLIEMGRRAAGGVPPALPEAETPPAPAGEAASGMPTAEVPVGEGEAEIGATPEVVEL